MELGEDLGTDIELGGILAGKIVSSLNELAKGESSVDSLHSND